MNGDGRVEESELRHILQSAHPSITDLDVNCLFNQVDSKRKGSVTFGKCGTHSSVNDNYLFVTTLLGSLNALLTETCKQPHV